MMTLEEAARHIEERMAEAWGGDRQWLTTGNQVADLVAETLRDLAKTPELSPEEMEALMSEEELELLKRIRRDRIAAGLSVLRRE